MSEPLTPEEARRALGHRLNALLDDRWHIGGKVMAAVDEYVARLDAARAGVPAEPHIEGAGDPAPSGAANGPAFESPAPARPAEPGDLAAALREAALALFDPMDHGSPSKLNEGHTPETSCAACVTVRSKRTQAIRRALVAFGDLPTVGFRAALSRPTPEPLDAERPCMRACGHFGPHDPDQVPPINKARLRDACVLVGGQDPDVPDSWDDFCSEVAREYAALAPTEPSHQETPDYLDRVDHGEFSEETPHA